jgi:predicted short-subunit dehydrogenase-like oxidoreductase (DUF2520 family)
MTTDKDRIAIIGMGKVGTAVGFLLRSAGYRIEAIADVSTTALRKGATYTGGRQCAAPGEAAAQADCTIIATTDDLIAPVCREIVAAGNIGPGAKIVHMSGAGGLELLAPARAAGAHVASIHPIQAFADVNGAIKNIPGSTFGITADEAIREWAVQIVRDLGGNPFFVPEADKPLYHAAACIASNYLVTLLHAVEEIYLSLGLDREEAIRSVWPLVKGTMNNIEARGTVQSLTGPIVRGDAGTIRKHVAALQDKLPSLLPMYRELGILTADIGCERNSLSEDGAAQIKEILKGGAR